MKQRLRGATIAVIAIILLGTIMLLPKFSYFGIWMGIGLLLVMGMGILDYFGVVNISKREKKKIVK